MNTRATVTINTKKDREQVSRWAQKVSIGTIVEFRKKTRSHEQNAKLHAMLFEVSEQVIWYGAKLKVEDWKNMFTASMRHVGVVPGIDPGTVVPLGIHTSTMTVDEMSNMIEAIYAFGADPAHLVTFKEPKQESGSAPEPAADDRPPSVSAAPDDVPPLASSGDQLTTNLEWLRNVSRMLWAAANYKGDMAVLKAQKVAAMASYPKPDGCSQIVTGKAEAAYGYCRQIVLGELEKADGLAMVAGVVGCDQHEIGRAA